MATTRISDLIEPQEFAEYTLERSRENSNFLNSGIVDFNAYSQFAQPGGRLTSMPFLNDLSDNDSAVGNDDPASTLTPEKATSGLMNAFTHYRIKSIEGARLAAFVAGVNPLTRLADRFVSYWDREYQKIAIQSAMGVLADNVANDSGDMVFSVASDSADAVVAADLMSGDVLVEGAQTMGDAKDNVVAVGLHSRVHANLQKAGLVQDHFNLETGALLFQTFLGKRVVMTDGMPAIAGTNRITYTTILFGEGAMAHGESDLPADEAVEVDRTPSAGNGAGVDTLYNRRALILHPVGVDFAGRKSAGYAGEGPTNTELAAAANWDRQFARKATPVAFIQTNG